jgi:hypothetical protein
LIAASNNHRGVLEQIQAFVGFGSIQVHPRNTTTQKPAYALHLNGLRVLSVAKQLAPLLIIKQRQAEVMIAFIERRLVQKTRPFTDEDYAFVAEMRRLNDRAPGRGSPIVPLPTPRERAQYGSIGSDPATKPGKVRERSRCSSTSIVRNVRSAVGERFERSWFISCS